MSLLVAIDGIPVGGLMSASIVTNNYFSADSFSLTFATGAAPMGDIASWSDCTDAYVEVGYFDAAFPLSTTMISGTIDLLTIDPILKTVSIEGRDLSSSLIDSYLQQDFVNQTASEVVQTIAGQHGLAVQVTATSGNVGRYFGDGYTKLSLGQFSSLRSNWDLVVELARNAHFDIFVRGRTLVFQPATSEFDSPVLINPGDVTAMRLERTLAIEPSANVQIQSWNSQKMASYRATTADVDETADEIGRLRTVLHLDMPWDLRLFARSLVLLQGTSSSFDGLYHVDYLERCYSPTSGSTQTVRAVSWPVSA